MHPSASACDQFRRWLDEGRPAAGLVTANSHASQCAVCARAEEAVGDLERLLALGPEPAPPGFVENVMGRIARSPVPAVSREAEDVPLPGWIRAVLDPGFVLSLTLAALLASGGNRFESGARAGHAWLRSILAPVAAGSTVFARPEAWIGLAMVLMPLLWMAGQVLYEASAAWTRRAFRLPS
jgi:hypothetical protein